MKIKFLKPFSVASEHEIPMGATVREFFELIEQKINQDAYISINEVKVDEKAVLNDGDTLIFAFPIKAEASPPLMRKFKRFLKKKGFKFHGQGKGDHEIWISTSNQKLTINPHNRDKKCVDWASFYSLQELLQCLFNDLHEQISKS